MFETKGRLFSQPTIEINDPKVLAVIEADNGESLVSLQEMFDQGILRLPSEVKTLIAGIEDTQIPLVRETIKSMLQKVAGFLGDNYSLVIIEPYRSYDFQKQLLLERVLQVMAGDKLIQREEAEKIAAKFVSNPDIYSPHVTGAAVDVAIMDRQTGDYLDMGNLFEYDEKAAMDCESLTVSQKENRYLLKKAMEKAGFVNYPNEWWHWSDGGKYAAMIKGEPEAKYSAVKLD